MGCDMKSNVKTKKVKKNGVKKKLSQEAQMVIDCLTDAAADFTNCMIGREQREGEEERLISVAEMQDAFDYYGPQWQGVPQSGEIAIYRRVDAAVKDVEDGEPDAIAMAYSLADELKEYEREEHGEDDSESCEFTGERFTDDGSDLGDIEDDIVYGADGVVGRFGDLLRLKRDN